MIRQGRHIAVVRKDPRAAHRKADQIRRAAAAQRADIALAGFGQDFADDPELGFEVIRAVIRRMAARASDLGGPARALGVLSGAAAEVCPAYEGPTRASAAEALFKLSAGGDE
jgi:hypothetical protein